MQNRKGIATETIFYLVIGIAVVALLVALVISYTRTTKSTAQCQIAENKFCERYAAAGFPSGTWWSTAASPARTDCGAPAGGTANSNWNCAVHDSGGACTASNAPVQKACENKGYEKP